MDALAWIAVLLFVAAGSYAWGASGLAPIVLRDFWRHMVIEGIDGICRSHPFSRWPHAGYAITWMFFGLPLFALVVAVALLLAIPVTLRLIYVMLRGGFRRGKVPPDPHHPAAPGMWMRIFERLTHTSAPREEDNVRPMRKRASMMHA